MKIRRQNSNGKGQVKANTYRFCKLFSVEKHRRDFPCLNRVPRITRYEQDVPQSNLWNIFVSSACPNWVKFFSETLRKLSEFFITSLDFKVSLCIHSNFTSASQRAEMNTTLLNRKERRKCTKKLLWFETNVVFSRGVSPLVEKMNKNLYTWPCSWALFFSFPIARRANKLYSLHSLASLRKLAASFSDLWAIHRRPATKEQDNLAVNICYGLLK